MTSFVLREANVLDRGGGFEGPLDVRVEDGRVAAVGADLPANDLPSHDLASLELLAHALEADMGARVGASLR